MSIKATHTPSGARHGGGGVPATVRYASGIPWPGITTGHDARCSCTWASYGGVYQVKYLDASCVIGEHHPRGRAG